MGLWVTWQAGVEFGTGLEAAPELVGVAVAWVLEEDGDGDLHTSVKVVGDRGSRGLTLTLILSVTLMVGDRAVKGIKWTSSPSVGCGKPKAATSATRSACS